MLRRWRLPEWLTLIGVVALFAATFFAWFERATGDVVRLNVWDLSVGRWFIYLALLIAAWMLIALALGNTPQWGVVLATPSVLFSLGALIALLVRWIDPLAGAQPQFGFYLALAGGAALFGGVVWSLRSESPATGFAPPPAAQVVHLDSAP